MRAYVPLAAVALAELVAARSLPGPFQACVVDPAWRAGAPDVDEEEWEFEAQQAAAARHARRNDGERTGAVLALDVELPSDAPIEDGGVEVPGPIALRDVAAVLDVELAWYGVQELRALLDG